MELNEYLEEYRALTLDIMDEIQKSAKLDSLIKERDEILKSIENLECDKEQIMLIGKTLDLLGLENELEGILKREKIKVKKKIEKFKMARKININYNNIEYKPRVFNKII